jgi:hypothetical protein
MPTTESFIEPIQPGSELIKTVRRCGYTVALDEFKLSRRTLHAVLRLIDSRESHKWPYVSAHRRAVRIANECSDSPCPSYEWLSVYEGAVSSIVNNTDNH